MLIIKGEIKMEEKSMDLESFYSYKISMLKLFYEDWKKNNLKNPKQYPLDGILIGDWEEQFDFYCEKDVNS